MADYKISGKAYTKIIFHAAKYPHCSVNGILLKEIDSNTSKGIHIVDAFPLFHQCLHVSPMAEIALTQIEAIGKENNLEIAGYYVAPENLNDFSIDKVPAAKIALKIAENYPNACLITVDNRLVTLSQENAALRIWRYDGKWIKSSIVLDNPKIILTAVSELLRRGAMKDIIDFDNHLDNPDNDWINTYLNRDLKQLLAMY